MSKVITFGIGGLFGITGDTPAQAVNFGILQEITPEFSFTEKELRGQRQFAEAVARTGGKISCKAKNAKIQIDVYAKLFFNLTPASGELLAAIEEAHDIPATPGPYTVTATHGADYDTDLGVLFEYATDDWRPMTRVTAGPTTGQYSVNTTTGVYTFAAADQGKSVKLSYLYTGASGETLTITNDLMDLVPTFKVVMSTKFQNKTVTWILNACSSSKLSFPMKSEDWMIPEFDFSAQADASGNIGKISITK